MPIAPKIAERSVLDQVRVLPARYDQLLVEFLQQLKAELFQKELTTIYPRSPKVGAPSR